MQQQSLEMSDERHQLLMQTGVTVGIQWPSCEKDGEPSTSRFPERSMSLAYTRRGNIENIPNRVQARKCSMVRREDQEKSARGTTLPRSVSVDGLHLHRSGGPASQVQLDVGHPDVFDAAEYRQLAFDPLGSWGTIHADERRSGDSRKALLMVGKKERSRAGSQKGSRDSWGSWDSSTSTSSDGDAKRPWVPGEGAVRIRDWSRVPGDTSITYGVRLYMSNINPNISHEENCERLLRQILERIAKEELDVPTLKMRHVIKVEAFLRSVELSVPSKTWHQSMRGALSLSSPVGSRKTLGHVDSMRVDAVVRGYAANAAEFLPLQRPTRRLLPPLLMCMACELLHVRLLGPEVRGVCRQIVSDYESRAKVWMSPQQNAERYLGPLVAHFVKWIRYNREIMYQGSATEGLVRSIDQDVRHRLKNQVYRSPEHFLMVVKSLEGQLTDTPLPSYDPSGGDDDHPFDVAQTLKDIKREKFYVDGVSMAPSNCWINIRASLVGGATATATGAYDGDNGHDSNHSSYSNDTPKGTGLIHDLVESDGMGNVVDDGQSASGGGAREPKRRDSDGRDKDVKGDKGDLNVSGDNLGTEVSLPACGDASTSAAAISGEGGQTNQYTRKQESDFDMYVDNCAWRVLHAASRTASSGDSFFVVQDLFGGEGVLIKSATTATEPIKIQTKRLAAKVTTVDKYDIYHASDVDIHSSTCEMAPQPLITITTTMKEVIEFPPFVPPIAPSLGDMGLKGQSLDSEESFQEVAGMQLYQPRVGRFITISASLPAIDEDHTFVSSRRDRRFGAGLVDEGLGSSNDTLLGAVSTGCAPSLRKCSSAPPGTNFGCILQRPSTFTPPPPEPFLGGWRRRRDSSSAGSDETEVEGYRTMSMVGLANDDMVLGGRY